VPYAQRMQVAILIYLLITSLRDDAAYREEQAMRSVQEIETETRLYTWALALLSGVLGALIVGFLVFVHQ
jgi:hypothetical protein